MSYASLKPSRSWLVSETVSAFYACLKKAKPVVNSRQAKPLAWPCAKVNEFGKAISIPALTDSFSPLINPLLVNSVPLS